MADKLLQQGKETEWLCDDETGEALVKARLVSQPDSGGGSGGQNPVDTTPQDYAARYDEVGNTIAYAGLAAVGAATGDSVWKLRRFTWGTGQNAADVVIEYADGNALFDKIWDNRASYTYS